MTPRSGGSKRPHGSGFDVLLDRTDHLTPRQVRLWNAISTVARALDSRGRPLHPTLYRLWHTVEQSGCRVVIELMTDKKRASNVAAECTIEQLDATGHGHTIKLTLFIPSIDPAYALQQGACDGLEFVPFSGLKGKSRYAKVLGHEPAHIALALNNPDYLRLLCEICTEQRIIAARVGEDGNPLSRAACKSAATGFGQKC